MLVPEGVTVGNADGAIHLADGGYGADFESVGVAAEGGGCGFGFCCGCGCGCRRRD